MTKKEYVINCSILLANQFFTLCLCMPDKVALGADWADKSARANVVIYSIKDTTAGHFLLRYQGVEIVVKSNHRFLENKA